MKFFRITWAEIKKIVCKPTFFIMAICVFVAITLSAFLYSPAKRENFQTSLSGTTLTSIYGSFNRPQSEDGKEATQNFVAAQFDSVKNFENRNDLQQFQNQICLTYKSNFDALENAILHASFNKSTLQNLYTSTREIVIFLNNMANSTEKVNFLISKADFQNMRNVFRSLFGALPSPDVIETLDDSAIETFCRSAWEFKDKIDSITKKCQALKPVVLDSKFLQEVDAMQTKIFDDLTAQEVAIEKFFEDNLQNDNDAQTLLAFKALLSDYKATAQIGARLLSNKLDLQILAGSSGNPDDYLGFDDNSLYGLKEETAFLSYIIQNNIAYSSTLTNLNFDQNSGFEKNGFDFAYFLLCVASLLINLIVVYFACMSFSGERHDGLMRMNMTKPISRTKLFLAKVSALVAISLVAHLVFGLLFTLIGVLIYGSASGSILIAVFGGTSAFATSPIAMIFVKIFALFLTSLFYVLVASLISNIFSNPVFSLVISYLVFIFASVTNTLLNKTTFIKFLPFIHTDLSTFFGGGIWQGKFLGSMIYSGASFTLSIIYFAVFCILLATSGIILINRQEN